MPSPRRRPEADAEKDAAPRRPERTPRQEELLDRLVALCIAEGFAHLTIEDLARRLSCSRTTLYALAPSKPELPVEITRAWFRGATERVERRLGAVEGQPADRRIEAYLRAVAAELQSLSPRFLCDVAEREGAERVYRRNTEAAADRIRQLLREGIAAGELRDVHAAFAGEMIAATMFEIQRGRGFERLGLSDAEAYAELAAFVVQALRPE